MFIWFNKQKYLQRWSEAETRYKERSQRANNLFWLLRRMERASFVPVDLPAVSGWIKMEIQAVKEKQQKNAEEWARRMGSDTTKMPQVQDDTLLILGQCEEMILGMGSLPIGKMDKSLTLHKTDVLAFLRRKLEQFNLDLEDQLEWMALQAQIGLEKIKLLICRPKPQWAQAGDILMHMWEVLIENGIKHEICMRHKPGVDPVQEFGTELKLEDLIIETRAEKAAREAKEKEA